MSKRYAHRVVGEKFGKAINRRKKALTSKKDSVVCKKPKKKSSHQEEPKGDAGRAGKGNTAIQCALAVGKWEI